MSAARPAPDPISPITTAEFARHDHASVVSLIQDLVRAPSRGGMDPYGDVADIVSRWMCGNGLAFRELRDEKTSAVVGIVCDIPGAHPGPRYILDACMDTAPFGDARLWRHSPTSGMIEKGWLYGRGAADSKAAIAIFLHIARRIRDQADRMHGTLTLLFDADEHTGNFGGAKQYFGGPDMPNDVKGVMIGYPGTDQLVIGGRGYLRCDLVVPGQAGHTGSQRTASNENAVERAADLVSTLARHATPGPLDDAIDLPPKLTVTQIQGGESYSIVPDRCTIKVDIRLTTTFDQAAASHLVEKIVAEVDKRWTRSGRTEIVFRDSWPAYSLPEHAPIRKALLKAAETHLSKAVRPRVAGPSNIGNYLASLGIEATAGFGVEYVGLHGTDERINLASIPPIQATYHDAVLTLLGIAS
jgi:succinyl-diaminopimelate desuccinylase